MKRRRMSRKGSRRLFKRTVGSKRRNRARKPRRGGWRL